MEKNLDLISELEDKIKTVRTKSLDLSFNELLDMYKSKELIIEPEYQRLFRWDSEQQSRFIESLLLEMPIPPIFVIECDEGVYELIDGLQRISTYMHFRGEHPNNTNDDPSQHDSKYLKLVGCDICKSLNGYTYSTLPKTLEIRLKRNFIRVEVLRKESDKRLRYHMFKRLNTGGSKLSEQEIRNCTIRLLSHEFNDFLIECSQYPSFKNCISSVNPEKIEQKYDQELVLRFFSVKNRQKQYVHDVSSYLTQCMEFFSTDNNFNYEEEEYIFKQTFDLLEKTLGEKSFSPATKTGKLASKFAIYHFEAISLCIANHIEQLMKLNTKQLKSLKSLLESIKRDEYFIGITTGGGKNYAGPLETRINFAEKKVSDFCNEL